MKLRHLLVFVSCLASIDVNGQQADSIITREGVERVLHFLSSDSMKGRGNFQTGSHHAARYIAAQFSKDSLQPFAGSSSLLIPFTKNGKKADAAPTYDPRRVLLNVVGVIRGTKKPDEMIFFTSHYDHLGVNRRKKKDSIFNGANDNASGTTAVLMLAHYFALSNDNERTLVFCAFSGEELGLLGSTAFAKGVVPGAVKAVINIEMIGRFGVGGKNSVFITGSGHSDLDEMLSSHLQGAGLKLVDEPDESKGLFMRSDNFPFALKGIPAHTIMSSDDDDECYHQPCDEVDRIDLEHMTAVIRALALATERLVNGEQTPRMNKRF